MAVIAVALSAPATSSVRNPAIHSRNTKCSTGDASIARPPRIAERELRPAGPFRHPRTMSASNYAWHFSHFAIWAPHRDLPGHAARHAVLTRASMR